MGRNNRIATKSQGFNVLLIEEDDADAEVILAELASAGLLLTATRATTKAQVRAALARSDRVDIVLCAYHGKGVKVWQALEIMEASTVAIPMIVVSGGLSDVEAAECMRLGATDYILMDRLGRLPHAVTQAVHHAKLERESREVERSYMRLFDSIPMAVFRTTTEGRVMHANLAAVEMFGFADLESMLATSASDLYVDPEERRALLARLETEPQLAEFEGRMRRTDGSEFWFSRTVHVAREEDGEVDVWESIGRDTTEHREATRRLRESEAYLRMVIETAPDAVVRMDEAGLITDWNSAAEKTFGWSRAEVLGLTVAETIVPLQHRREHEDGLARFRRDGSGKLIGGRWDAFNGLRKNGEVFPIEMAISPPIPVGESNQFVCFARDISARRSAQLDLAKSEERLRSLLAGAPVAVMTLDRDGRFTYAGGSVFTQLGLDPSSVVGLMLTESFPDRPDFVELLAGALEGDVHTDLEFAGRTFHVRCGPFRLTPDGEVIGVGAVAFDNTDRVEADCALRRSEEVFRALFEQSAVGISLHEIPQDSLPGRVQWNNRMRKMLGVLGDADESSWMSVLPGEEQTQTEEAYRRLLTGEATELRERRRLSRPDETAVWADLSTVLVRDREQQPLRFQTIALDVTEQIAAETRLSRRAAQQGVLVELSRAGLEGSTTSDFLATAVELAAHGTGTQFGTILELRARDECLIRIATYGDDSDDPPEPVPLMASFLMIEALKSEGPVAVRDYERRPELDRSAWMIERGVVGSMAVRIRAGASPFGVLTVHSDVAREFSADDLQFMQLASTIISVTIERNRGEQQRRMLLRRVVTAQEVERKTIAADIHDDAVQVMTAANMRLELFRMVLTDPVQVDAAKRLQETVAMATGRLRNLLFQLSPADLDRHGLASAFRRHLEQFEADGGGRWHMDSRLKQEPPPQVGILLFRIFQEALVNVLKHAQATSVSVSLETADGGVMMRLADDGIGSREPLAEPLAGHLGLASMRERAEIAGGWWRISSEPGRGTEISAWVPATPDSDISGGRAAEDMAIG
jgi:PAS domain S-box-containing protein